MLNGNEKERELIGSTLTGEYYEDWDGDAKAVIKY